jgi:phage-related protein
MATGFTLLDGSTRAVPDKGFTRDDTPIIFKTTFGDGYEQRVANGINALSSKFSVSFNTRPKAEIDDIIAFFTSKNGVTAFNWTIPDTNGSENGNTETTIKVVCENWSQTWDYDDFYTASATLLRVYEA